MATQISSLESAGDEISAWGQAMAAPCKGSQQAKWGGLHSVDLDPFLVCGPCFPLGFDSMRFQGSAW